MYLFLLSQISCPVISNDISIEQMHLYFCICTHKQLSIANHLMTEMLHTNGSR